MKNRLVRTDVCRYHHDMEGTAAHHYLMWLESFEVSCADEQAVLSAWSGVGLIRQHLDLLEVDLAQRLLEVTRSPENAIIDALGVSWGRAVRLVERARLLADVHAATARLAQHFRSGVIGVDHVNAFAAVQRGVEPELMEAFLGDTSAVEAAPGLSALRFGERLRMAADRHRRKLGIDRLESQKRHIRVRTRLAASTGMWHLCGQYDPETAAFLSSRLDAAVDEIIAAGVSDACPIDPVERIGYLRAMALAQLIRGQAGVSRGRPEMLVVVDTTQRNEFGEPAVDWGLPVELPITSLIRFFDHRPGITVVDIARDGTLNDRTDRLDLGRETRLANRVQRRVLRGLHATCVVPGCEVPFAHCDIHHVQWWRHGGTTDLGNLAPVCPHHHGRIHDDGWVLTLDERRHVRVDRPDGLVMTTGPPAAA
jgi:hypothetical protein